MIYPTAKISPRTELRLCENVMIGDHVLISVPRLFVGEGSQINSGVKIVGNANCYIGSHVVVGYNVCILTSSDTLAPRMDDASPLSERKVLSKDILLGAYSYIGANSVLMPGVTIGKNSVIGALSYVNKSVKDYEVGWGQPWKFRRYRWSSEKERKCIMDTG